MRVLLPLLFIFSSSLVFSQEKRYVGEVIKTRGKVTVLAPGDLLARKVLVGQKVKEDTSLVTGAHSFVQVKFEDGSLMSLGPHSKGIVYHLDRGGNGVIGLLKGVMRNEVRPSADGKKKLYLRTLNTVVGVRGTEFETIYNAKNRLTTLLTYEGEVAMAQVDNRGLGPTDVKNAKRIVRNYDDKMVLEEEPSLSRTTNEAMEDLLNSEQAVNVGRGQLSQTLEKLKAVSPPVKISPVQLNILFKNTEFEKKPGLKISEASVDPKGQDILLKPAPQNVPMEGLLDLKNGTYAPKAGGFLDRDTGLYIPPTKEALFDQIHQIYIPDNIGSIDQSTGQYEPPVGLKITADEGFTLRKFKSGTPDEFVAKVTAQADYLNNVLRRDLVVSKGEIEENDDGRGILSTRELISRNILSVSFRPISQTITQENDTTLGTNREFSSEGGREVSIALDYASGFKFQPTTFITFRNVEIPASERSGGITQTGNDLITLGAGLNYSLSSRWNFQFDIMLDQQYFLHHQTSNSTTTSDFIRVTIPKFNFGFNGVLIRSGKLSVESMVLLGTNLSKETGTHKLDGFGFHYIVSNGITYWPWQKWFVNAGFTFSGESLSTSGTSRVYTADVKRSTTGLFFTLGRYF